LERTFREVWEEQRAGWQRFRAWEDEQLRLAPRDYGRALAWMSEAWELAGLHDPGWGGAAGFAEHCRHVSRIQRLLARAFGET
jgi:hypothetical protein